MHQRLSNKKKHRTGPTTNDLVKTITYLGSQESTGFFANSSSGLVRKQHLLYNYYGPCIFLSLSLSVYIYIYLSLSLSPHHPLQELRHLAKASLRPYCIPLSHNCNLNSKPISPNPLTESSSESELLRPETLHNTRPYTFSGTKLWVIEPSAEPLSYNR